MNASLTTRSTMRHRSRDIEPWQSMTYTSADRTTRTSVLMHNNPMPAAGTMCARRLGPRWCRYSLPVILLHLQCPEHHHRCR